LTEAIIIIDDLIWLNAKRELVNKFRHSTKFEIVANIIKDFEFINPKKKYKSDLEIFIRESKLEDFFKEGGETIFVSTIHKAKGREFDTVFLMLENYNLATDAAKRQLYVALTRAKRNLVIHQNTSIFDNFTTQNVVRSENRENHLPPNELVIHLSLKDVWLDYFIHRQALISKLISGDVLTLNGDECLDSNGKSVLRFSKQFMNQIDTMKTKNYELKSAKVNFIVYWKKEETKEDVKIILPELYFERMNNK
jgi:ATP-dependent DNA helicase RecQ